MANVHLASRHTFELPLQPLRDRRLDGEAAELLASLRGMTAKPLTQKNPNLPTSDALAHWEGIRELVSRAADMYSRAEK